MDTQSTLEEIRLQGATGTGSDVKTDCPINAVRHERAWVPVGVANYNGYKKASKKKTTTTKLLIILQRKTNYILYHFL